MTEFLWLILAAYFTAVETQAELYVQAEGYEQVTAHCSRWECSWVARSKNDGGWESGRARCSPLTLVCEIRR